MTGATKYLCLTCGLVHELRFGRCNACDGEVRAWKLVHAVLVAQGVLPREPEPPAPAPDHEGRDG